MNEVHQNLLTRSAQEIIPDHARIESVDVPQVHLRGRRLHRLDHRPRGQRGSLGRRSHQPAGREPWQVPDCFAQRQEAARAAERANVLLAEHALAAMHDAGRLILAAEPGETTVSEAEERADATQEPATAAREQPAKLAEPAIDAAEELVGNPGCERLRGNLLEHLGEADDKSVEPPG